MKLVIELMKDFLNDKISTKMFIKSFEDMYYEVSKNIENQENRTTIENLIRYCALTVENKEDRNEYDLYISPAKLKTLVLNELKKLEKIQEQNKSFKNDYDLGK